MRVPLVPIYIMWIEQKFMYDRKICQSNSIKSILTKLFYMLTFIENNNFLFDKSLTDALYIFCYFAFVIQIINIMKFVIHY